MAFAVKLEKFEGPLDLLLQLIETEKLDISQISLAKVTDEYVHRLQEHPDLPPEEMADFLVIASRLLLIKSRVLLPFLNIGEEEPIGDLEAQLKIYKEYLDASKVVASLIGKRRFLFVHEKLPHIEIGFAPPKQLAQAQMAEMFRGVLKRLDLIVRIPRAVIEKTVSIHEKISYIQSLITQATKISFRTLLTNAESRIEIVVSFLALLELVKQRSVSVSQSGMFDDITIEKIEAVPA
jgi:segregation and condensation protein A